MSFRVASICNALKGLGVGGPIFPTSRLFASQRALSRSNDQGTTPVTVHDGVAGDQSRQITSTAEKGSSRLVDSDPTAAENGSSRLDTARSSPMGGNGQASVIPQPPQTKDAVYRSSGSMPVNTSSDYSIANEARWKSFTRANGTSGNMCVGRSILLTGGTSGIGLAVAKRAVLEGASHVIIVTRNASKGSDAVQTIKETTGFPDAPVSYLNHDFSKSPPEIVRSILNPLYINTLINCSGLTSNQLVVRQRREDAEMVWDTNYHMPFKLSQQLLSSYMSRMRALQRGQSDNPTSEPSWCIVNVSSLLAEKGGKGSATYAATKAALVALTRVLALESGDISERSQGLMSPIRVNAILPGYIDTPMVEGFSKDRKAELTAQIPLRRFGRPAEVADAIMFLLHNEYANNCILNLDGGLSAV